MVIELKNVSVYHPDALSGKVKKGGGDLVLSNVTLSVGEGEMVYFIGKVGSGKSSLLKVLYAELPLVEGYGPIAGFDLRQMKRSDIATLRRNIGIVFQDNQLLTDRNVFHNLHYVMQATGWKNEVNMRRKIEQVLELVGLQNKIYKMPFELSGGEQQRLCIARALINNPKIILADEPTGNLDPAATDEVMRLFKRIVNGGCSIVMSTHNLNIIEEYPSRTIRFSKGAVEELDIASILS
ncbi:MAG: ATP-binding cassette domain-containing protein [Tidjanibacter sp.]|nr:ATP-binding cassette domain-containing protein [Tidjanibacter sp.]